MASGSKPRWRDRFRSWKPSIGASQYSHKTKQAALKSVLGALESSLNQLPSLQLAVDGLIECVTRLEITEQNRQAYNEIMSDLTTLATLLQKHVVESNPQSMPYSMENVARAISEQTEYIKHEQERSQISQLVLAKEDEEAVLRCYRRADVSLSIWDAIREQQMDTRLKNLLPAHDAYFNAALPTTVTKRVGCTKNTRVEILKAIRDWARGADGPKIYWMNGMAGTGKTTIAYTICKILHEGRQLGASFFCSRNSPDCRNVNKIVPTIAYQLGRYSNPYRQALCDVLNRDPDVAKKDITTQFEQLISKPLAKMGKGMPDDVVVVIDALDECTDVGGTRDVLNLLLGHASVLPIRFFVASRPESGISDGMTSGKGTPRSILRLHDIEKSFVQADIRTYLAEALESVQAAPSELDALADRAGALFIYAATAVRYIAPDKGPANHRQRLLVMLKLQPSHGSKSYRDIDDLYTAILSNALDTEVFEEDEIAPRLHVLWTVVCAREALTISSLAELLSVSNHQAVQLAIQPLQSVLHVTESTQMVSTLHTSFPDFLLDEERAGRFHCDEALQSSYLAEWCFRVMDQSLRFNICALESSYWLDSEVKDLQNRIDKAISPGLFYSCIYWSEHITRAPFSPPLLLVLDSFMKRRLLFWLEVLNLKGRLGYGDGVLSKVLTWLPVEDHTAELRDLIHDARSFIVTLASNPISLSTPHIYISALPFTSRQSHVWISYWPKTRGLVQVHGATGRSPILATWVAGDSVYSVAQSNDGKLVASASGASIWTDLGMQEIRGEITIWDASSGIQIFGRLQGHQWLTHVRSVAFSLDNTRLLSGSSDGFVFIWDARKGVSIAGPLRGHTSAVNSVAFSPDGSRIASGSNDQTIRLWDAYTGVSLTEPLQGHQDAVNSIMFSPNGKHLASGSSDGTIRVWDFLAGILIQEPIEGHTDAVQSIAYSPDGRRLVSGSADCTVRVWNILDGTLLAGPFKGHTRTIRSTSFSPDGTRIVSGSDDGTIRVWESASGRLLTGPLKGRESAFDGSVNSVLFSVDGTRILSGSANHRICVWDSRFEAEGAPTSKGHTGSIHSVSLSPDGARVASGSSDSTVYVWDTDDGTLLTGPLCGHISEVRSVAFSPDGACIVSGSQDCTLRTWDSFTGVLLVGPISGHTGPVQSVAFSPDGSQIASGSDDGTVRLWHSRTGESVAEPSKGHAGPVMSIAFSPDGSRIVSGLHLPRLPSDGSNDRFPYETKESTVRLSLASDGTTLWKSYAHANHVNCVAFSPDETRVVSGSSDWTVRVLDARDGAVLHGPFGGHFHRVTSVAFSPDGARVVSGSSDRTVRVWDVESSTTVAGPLKGHTGDVTSVTFSPDGARIISGSHDRTIRIWDAADIAPASATWSNDWSIDGDGWQTGSQSRRLFWLPPDLRQRFGFLTPSNPVVINADCTARTDDTTLLGDRWHECYPGSLSS